MSPWRLWGRDLVLRDNSIACSSWWSMSRKAWRHRKQKHGQLVNSLQCGVETGEGNEVALSSTLQSLCDFQECSLYGTSCPEAKLMELRREQIFMWTTLSQVFFFFKKRLKIVKVVCLFVSMLCQIPEFVAALNTTLLNSFTQLNLPSQWDMGKEQLSMFHNF